MSNLVSKRFKSALDNIAEIYSSVSHLLTAEDKFRLSKVDEIISVETANHEALRAINLWENKYLNILIELQTRENQQEKFK